MIRTYSKDPDDESFALSLQVVSWILADQDRAQRMLALTGLDPDALRANLSRPAMLRALIEFVMNHEPDFLECAASLGVEPGAIVAARRALSQ